MFERCDIMDKTSELFTSRVFRKSRSESSVHTYLAAVKQFAAFMRRESLDDLARDIESGKVDLVRNLNSWLDKLDQDNRSPQTQNVYFAAVKKFVQVVLPDLEFKWKRVDLPTVYRVEEDRIPTKEELRTLMYHGGLKDEMIITFAASSGVRENTLVSLTFGDVDLETYEDIGVVKVKPLATKGRVQYVTCITPEAKKFLQQYFRYRERHGERIDSNSFIIGNPPMSAMGLRQRWERLLKKSGKDERSRIFHMLRMHTLRKFFRTSMELAGVSKSFTEKMMGHKGYLDQAYFKPAVEQIVNEYRKAIPNLTVMEEVKYEQLRKRQALDTLKLLGFDEEKLKRVEEILTRAKNMDDAMEKIRRLKDQEFTGNSDNGSYVNNNGYRAKVVSEAELLAHVEAGWDVVKELSNGKFIVRKQNGSL